MTRTSIAKAAALSLMLAMSALPDTGHAQSAFGGIVTNVSADPSDFVVELNQPGSCGSGYFHIQRSKENFDEMVAVALTAFATGKQLTLFVASCAGNRNIVSHGYSSR